MAAAVADVKPVHTHGDKLPKHALPTALDLEFVPDVVAGLSALKQPHQRLIGFAAQTGDIIAPALEKLRQKHLDAIVANPIDQPDSGFSSDFNRAIFLDAQGGQTDIPRSHKLDVAHQLWDFVGGL
jgi:phosphopantothenoylcysteine decarboxylase/phosphopantothenate--cysteine ligase